jgi:voltage-gated potassium channel
LTPRVSTSAHNASRRGPPEQPRLAPWREKLHEIIFRADTPAGKIFDLALLTAIVASVLAVALESVQPLGERYAKELRVVEWVLTGLFTVEYILRLICVRSPRKYATSFFGLIDLLAILPSYLALLIPGAQTLMTVRILRLVRVFRVLKLTEYVSEGAVLLRALKASRPKIVVFLVFVASVVCTLGSLMYVVEGPGSGFENIPLGMYWAIVTLTTVGYGDITPQTGFGKVVASFIMILGYAVIAVPTGIVTTELAIASRRPLEADARVCAACGAAGHTADAGFCRMCGSRL